MTGNRATAGPAGTARRLGGHLVNVVLVLFTLLGLAYLAPSVMGYERYVITGGSMSGTFERGSLVLERKVPVEDLEVGDVITYLPPQDSGVRTLVTHRITKIRVDEEGRRVFRTQGDANPDPDPWRFSLTDTEQPVVEVAVPYAGYVFIALADRDTRILLVGGPAALIALGSLVQLVGALRSRLRERRRDETDETVPSRGGPVELASTSRGTPLRSVDHDTKTPALTH
ncbi:signal peptidase I [Nocardioides sp. TF02-7]|uniref:signal peptidase I n=1 Tax=Nocardioides sp. TF02-7 TaxID=2917724 RepID=UPI001F066836|nr:signal peptidase I [Nocardioides sp. TF02-7]UMG94288.1 signal peptidase I [Nocardioides sp. TF02-7]